VGRTNRLLSFDTTRTKWQMTRPKIIASVFVAAENFTEPLASNGSAIRIQTHRLMGGIYMYAIEMGSGAKFHTD
jgi:hypothetical protein